MRICLPEPVRAEFSRQDLHPTLVALCNRIVSSTDKRTVKPFEPDILGEAFFLRFLERFEDSPEVMQTLIAMLASGDSEEQQVRAANSFLETMQRLVRNLINDDQQLDAVKASIITGTEIIAVAPTEMVPRSQLRSLPVTPQLPLVESLALLQPGTAPWNIIPAGSVSVRSV